MVVGFREFLSVVQKRGCRISRCRPTSEMALIRFFCRFFPLMFELLEKNYTSSTRRAWCFFRFLVGLASPIPE